MFHGYYFVEFASLKIVREEKIKFWYRNSWKPNNLQNMSLSDSFGINPQNQLLVISEYNCV